MGHRDTLQARKAYVPVICPLPLVSPLLHLAPHVLLREIPANHSEHALPMYIYAAVTLLDKVPRADRF